MSCQAPFKRGISYECPKLFLVDESNQMRQLIQTWDMMVPNLTPFVVNIPSLQKKRLSNIRPIVKQSPLELNQALVKIDDFSCVITRVSRVSSRIKLGTCENRRFQLGNDKGVQYYQKYRRIRQIHTAFFIFL